MCYQSSTGPETGHIKMLVRITCNISQVFFLREIFDRVPLNAAHNYHQILWLSGGQPIQINDATTETKISSVHPLYSRSVIQTVWSSEETQRFSRGNVWLQLGSSQPGDLAGAQFGHISGGQALDYIHLSSWGSSYHLPLSLHYCLGKLVSLNPL